jgi:hypothetical protein
MCVIIHCRCVCWIDDITFTTTIPGIPLGRYCNCRRFPSSPLVCRRFPSSPLVRVVKFNYRFSGHYISLMSHWWTIASQPFFGFCMFPMCSLRRSQKHLSFYPIIRCPNFNFHILHIVKEECRHILKPNNEASLKSVQSSIQPDGQFICLFTLRFTYSKGRVSAYSEAE